VAEGSGLLNRQTLTGLVGSNPTSSASTKNNLNKVVFVCASEMMWDSKVGAMPPGRRDGVEST
jgi:hypothetical protein